MTVELIVSALPGETRAAVLRESSLEDLLVMRDGMAVAPGDRFLARVQRFDPGLEAAFVDLGLERAGLLPRREMTGAVPSEGATLVVSVIRAPSGDKGAKVSARRRVDQAEVPTGCKAPARLPGGPGPLLDFLASTQPAVVVCDDAALLQRLKSGPGGQGSDFVLHSDAPPLFEAWDLEDQVERLLQPRVDCPGGGFLLIEPVQTLTAIDVNAGRHDGRGGASRQARDVNLAAVPVIARQLRLRALSGLIVVDFLAMQELTDRKALAAALRQAVKEDPEPCQVFNVSPSGLLEMTRRRARAPLHELLCRPCGLGGRGWEKTPETLAYEALRQLAAAGRGKAVKKVELRARPEVLRALQGAQAAALASVEQRLGRAVALIGDPLIERHDIVLG